MRYHYEKPQIYLSMYGVRYVCEHPVYNSCTLFLIGDKGIAVIQQRFDARTKTTWWSEVDLWLTDDLYLHPNFSCYERSVLIMKLNEKQTHALEEIYRVARMYTKIAAELNKVADTIELESEKNDEEFMKVFGVSQGYYMNDIVRVFDNLPEHVHEQIGELIIAFKK